MRGQRMPCRPPWALATAKLTELGAGPLEYRRPDDRLRSGASGDRSLMTYEIYDRKYLSAMEIREKHAIFLTGRTVFAVSDAVSGYLNRCCFREILFMVGSAGGRGPTRRNGPPPKTPRTAPGETQKARIDMPAKRSPKPALADDRRRGISKPWTFLTNHAHVLIVLHGNPELVLREVAQRVGITERAVQRIVQDLETGGFIRREKIGRQNHYEVLKNKSLRHPIEAHRTIGDLLKLVSN